MLKVLKDISELTKAIKEDETLTAEFIDDDLDSLAKWLNSFSEYFNAVVNMQSIMSIYSVQYEGEEYRDRVQALDQTRRDKHILATQAINKINRSAKSYGMSEIFPVGKELKPDPREWKDDPQAERKAKDDRELAADYIYEFCKQVFLDGQSHNQYLSNKREQELYEMEVNHTSFKTNLSLDEILTKMHSGDLHDSVDENEER